MGRNEFLTLIFFFLLIFTDCSDASLPSNFRKLVGLPSKDTPVPPMSSSDSGGKGLNPKPVDVDKSGNEKKKEPQVPNTNTSPQVVNPKGLNNGSDSNTGSNNNTSSENRPVDKKINKEKDNDKGKEKSEVGTNHSNNGSDNNTALANPPTDKKINEEEEDRKGNEESDVRTELLLGTDGRCESSPKKCPDQRIVVACIQEAGFKKMVLVVQNEGESTLEVNITIPTTMGNSTSKHKIAKNRIERINISLDLGQSTKIVLSAGKGDCVLQIGPFVTVGNFFQHLPSYYKQVTPIYGAYFLFLIALIVGGSWACCKFSKRTRQAGVPYQELEMALPETASAVNVDSAQGWDQGWDDDWDEERAVKSPGGRHVGNISANGLTSRSTNRDGWENDWDD